MNFSHINREWKRTVCLRWCFVFLRYDAVSKALVPILIHPSDN